MGEEIIIQDENGKKYSILRVLDADTKKIINDLLDIVKQKDRMIDLMAQSIDNYDSQLEICSFKDKEDVKRLFEERCK